MKERTTIDVIMVEPGKEARMMTMNDSLEAMQDVVGGLIEEYMPFEDDVAIICNEEGKAMQMPLCRAIIDERGKVLDIIAGPFFITYAPIESENFLSMPDELREKYLEKFRQPERFFRTPEGIKVVKFDPNGTDIKTLKFSMSSMRKEEE